MQMVSEIMTRDVRIVSPQESVRRAAQMMDELNVGALPVCDGERLVGIITDRDITVRATSAGLGPDDAVVDDVMSTDVRWCFEDQAVEEVMRQMADTQIRRVPVVSHDERHLLVGIVSLGDIATRMAAGGQRPDIEQVVEKVSFPSEPDRSGQKNAAGRAGATASDAGSHVGTGAGLAGSDVLNEMLNPDVAVSSTADPSDEVEVSPEELVNRNAPGSTSIAAKPRQEEGIVVRRTVAGGADDTTTGESGAPAGVDTGVAGASGGVAGTTAAPGTNNDTRP